MPKLGARIITTHLGVLYAVAILFFTAGVLFALGMWWLLTIYAGVSVWIYYVNRPIVWHTKQKGKPPC